MLSAPRVREQLNAVVDRGGRVVVVDPRRTETARQYEHVAIRPDTDAWLLLSMLQVVFAEGLEDRAWLERGGRGAETLAERVRDFDPERTEGITGVPAPTVRELARAFAAAPGAAAYGRTGSCLGRFGTLVAYLLDALNAVTGNLDRPGGAVFGRPPIALDEIAEKAGLATYGKVRSRFGNYPDVIGNLPATLIPKEITTPGARQIRAFFVSAGNPVLSVPDGDALEAAFGELDLLVSLDFYVTDTSRHADYILPTTTFLEREDVPGRVHGLLQHSVHAGHRGGRAAARRGPPGVAHHRGPLPADRDRPLLVEGAADARPPRAAPLAMAPDRRGCCAPARPATGSA